MKDDLEGVSPEATFNVQLAAQTMRRFLDVLERIKTQKFAEAFRDCPRLKNWTVSIDAEERSIVSEAELVIANGRLR